MIMIFLIGVKKYFLIMKNLICFLCVFYRMLFWKELNLLLSYLYLFKGNNKYLLKNRKGFVEWIVIDIFIF